MTIYNVVQKQFMEGYLIVEKVFENMRCWFTKSGFKHHVIMSPSKIAKRPYLAHDIPVKSSRGEGRKV